MAALNLPEEVGLALFLRDSYTPPPLRKLPGDILSFIAIMVRTVYCPTFVYRLTWVIVMVGLLTLSSGCVRRRLMVRSNPPGALVYVDNQQIGTTPCGVDFTYYGTREIRLVKAGYETLTVNQPIPMPWYQVPPLDFFSENLTPNKIVDNRTVVFDLAPQVIVPTQELVDRANQLRHDTQQYPVAPAAATVPTGPLGPTVVPPPAAPPSAVFAPPPPATPPVVIPAAPPSTPPIVSPPLR